MIKDEPIVYTYFSEFPHSPWRIRSTTTAEEGSGSGVGDGVPTQAHATTASVDTWRHPWAGTPRE
jgi:hypothetical protein